MFSDIQKKMQLHSNHFPNSIIISLTMRLLNGEIDNRMNTTIPTAIDLLIPTPG